MSNEEPPLIALWRRYLRGGEPFADFRRQLLKTDLTAAGEMLDAYRALREPINAQNYERHSVGLATFAQHVMGGDALTARAALQILVDQDLCDVRRATEFAELDAYCSGRLDDFAPFFAITARYRLDRSAAQRLMTRAASTLGMLAALDRQDWQALHGCQLIVESGCHPLAVNLIAKRCAPRLMVFDSAAEQSRFEGLGDASVNLDEYFTLNSPQEIECYDGVEQITADILARCGGAPLAWLADQAEIIETSRFAIEDSLYAASKRAAGLCDLLDGVEADVPNLLLLAQGRQLRLLAGTGRPRQNLHYFWCNHHQLAQRGRSLQRFKKRLEAADAVACPADLLAALKPVLATFSRRERIRQWLRAVLPLAVIHDLVQLLELRRTLRRRKPWRPPLPRALLAWRWQLRSRRFDFVFARAARRALRFCVAPLDILFFTSASPIYLDTVQDLIRHTDRLGLRTAIVVRGLGNGVLDGGPHRTIDYLELMQHPQVRRLNSVLARNVAAHLRRLQLSQLMVLDSRYGPLDLTFTIRQGMEAIVTAALLRSHLFESLVRLLLQEAAPRRVVVAPDRVPEALSVIRQCRARGIPTWTIQTVYHSRHPRYKPLQADFTTLIDTWSFSLFRDHFAVDPRRLFITGSPRMQFKIADERPMPRKQLLFICQRGVPFNLANLDYVLRNLDEFNDYDLVVRPHPSETPHQVRSYQALLSRYPRQRASIDPARPLREVMLEASVVLVAYSNVGLEAACYGIPVLVINPTRIEYPVAMDEMGIGFPVSSDVELRSALRRVSDDAQFLQQLAHSQRSYLDSNAHLLHGDPVERIVALIVADDNGSAFAQPLASHDAPRDSTSTAQHHPQDVKLV